MGEPQPAIFRAISRLYALAPSMPVAQLSQRCLQRPFQLVRRALRRLLHARGLVLDGGGPAAFEAGLDRAVLVVLAALAGIRVAEMDLQRRDVIGEAGEGVAHQVLDPGREVRAAGDILVRPDIDLHFRFP